VSSIDNGPPQAVAQHGSVRVITLNRPERRNVIDIPDRTALLERLREAFSDPGTRSVVLTGAGRIFCAGGDITSMDADPMTLNHRLGLAGELARLLTDAPVPLVVAVNGGAYGLGLSIAMACDVVVADEGARFASSFGRLGLVADTGLAWSLTQRVGRTRARELILSSRTVPVDEAHRLGMVDHVVPVDGLLERAMRVAEHFAAQSSPMVAATREMFADPQFSLDSVLRHEKTTQLRLLAGNDFSEGRAAFSEGLTPTFTDTHGRATVMTIQLSGLLAGKVAVVTGGAQGLGLSMAQAFHNAGAKVVIGDLDGRRAAEAAADLGTEDVAAGVACDVVDAGAVQALIDTAVERFGSLDVYVNNAGITRDATMRTMAEDDFDAVINVHLKGCWNGTRLASAVMREQKSGAIVNISSLSGKVGMVGQTNYSAAKAGIVGMTKAAAKEMAHHGVRVNAIQPGLIRSAMTEAMPQKAWDQKMSEIPMGRPGEPDEVASVALFLASDLSSYMTGAVLEVTGGRFM